MSDKKIATLVSMQLRHGASAEVSAVDVYDVGTFVELTVKGDSESGTRESITVQLTSADVRHLVTLLKAAQSDVDDMTPWNAK